MHFPGTMAISSRLSSTFSSSLPVSLSLSNASPAIVLRVSFTNAAEAMIAHSFAPVSLPIAFDFLLIVYQMGRNTSVAVTEKKCTFCCGSIELQAVRCSKCTSWLDMDEYVRSEELKTKTLSEGDLRQKTGHADYVDKRVSLGSIA